MSQAKVDRYKEEKKNRKKNMRREKRNHYIGCTVAILIAAGLVGWAGYSIYLGYESSRPASYTEVDMSALTDYYSNLQVD